MIDAIFAVNPNVVTVRNLVAYDKDENVIEYDLAEVEAKAAEMEAEAQAAVAAQAAARQSALAKLKKLGLTEEEALALGVTK